MNTRRRTSQTDVVYWIGCIYRPFIFLKGAGCRVVSRPRDLSTFEDPSRPVDTRDVPPEASSEIDATRADFRWNSYAS